MLLDSTMPPDGGNPRGRLYDAASTQVVAVGAGLWEDKEGKTDRCPGATREAMPHVDPLVVSYAATVNPVHWPPLAQG
ncbi:MAG: hypothetical protein K0S60_551 [Evtepia sp.]|jgi:hypothetical protein|nr:hypothetical protein [Evtepia sp.]